jgi:hypothetical protein
MTTTPYSNHGFIELHVPDIKSAREYYLKLGFKLVWEIDTYFVVKFDKTILAFNYGLFTPPLGVGAEIVVQVETQSIQDYYQFICSLKDINIVEPLKTQVWHKTDFRIHDLNGYYLRFTEPENILYN